MELTKLLELATTDVEPSPALLTQTRRGGQRRIRRRRASAGSLALVLALVGFAAPRALSRQGPDRVVFAGALFDGQTHGDLSSDATYRASVLQAWGASHATSLNAGRGIFEDMRGQAKVVWAGTTPAGPAAVVSQDAFLHHHADISLEHEGVYQLLGFVGPGADGQPTVVADTYPAPGVQSDIAWYVDSGRHVVAALDTGKPLGISFGWVYGKDGSVSRTYAPMSQHDGVALFELPPGTVPGLSVHLGLLPVTSPDDVRGVLGGVVDTRPAMKRLDWINPGGQGETVMPLGGSWQADAGQLRARFNAAVRAHQSGGTPFSEGFSLWYAYGTTPSGRQVVVGEHQLEEDPSHLYAVLGTGSGQVFVPGGEVDPASPLPVAIRLPDSDGWIVASFERTLEYRIGTGAWIRAGRDAALVPDASTAVRVTGNSQIVVPLTH
ncbi:MAG: hypothetical protein JWP11_848 [Frankiales bacterium]|nr:hypothetical protein [Frankiales bacterium]